MRTLLAIIWLLFGGLWLALGYALARLIFRILIVTIPLGVASFRCQPHVVAVRPGRRRRS